MSIFVPLCAYLIFLLFLKLISNPISLLLEDKGSETSSKGHDQRISVFRCGIGINITRYKETVSSELWVKTAFLLSYVPPGFAVAVLVITGFLKPPLHLALDLEFSLILSNASLHKPFLNC